eukprot:11189450-Lingulodinium_polyedra.AAC.1
MQPRARNRHTAYADMGRCGETRRLTTQKPCQTQLMAITHFGAQTCHVDRVFVLYTYAHAAFDKRFSNQANGTVDCFRR